MTDKEFLELAAKACGFKIAFVNGYPRYATEEGLPTRQPWNPLESDYDAFRLAAKLGIDVTWNKTRRSSYEEDLLTVRRAIVKAAAKLGEQQNA